MKTIIRGIRTLVIFSIGIMFISSCTSTRVNLVDTGVITIERLPSKGIYVSRTYVYKNDNNLIVSGNVKRSKKGGLSSGHVDIGLFSPNGAVLESLSTSYTPQIIRRRGGRESSFTAFIHGIPPQGSKIKVIHHRLPYLASNTFDCGENAIIH